jgi:phage anti-repressor protein
MRPTSWFKRWWTAQYWLIKADDYQTEWDNAAFRADYTGMNCSERRSAFIKIMEKEGLVQGVDFVACNPIVKYWDKADASWKTNMHMFIELYGTNKRDRKGRQVLNGYRIDPSAPDTEIVSFWKAEYDK